MPKFEMNLDFKAIEKDINDFLRNNITYNFNYLDEIVKSINSNITDAVRNIIIDQVRLYFRTNKEIKTHIKTEIELMLPKILNDEFFKFAKRTLKMALEDNEPLKKRFSKK